MGKLHGLHAGILVHVLTLRAFAAVEIQQRQGQHFETDFSGSSLYSPSERLIEQPGQAVFWGLSHSIDYFSGIVRVTVLFRGLGLFNHDKLKNTLTAELLSLSERFSMACGFVGVKTVEREGR